MSLPRLPLVVSSERRLPPLAAEKPAIQMDVRTRTITDASPALAALLGRPAESLIGRPLCDLWLPHERAAVMRRFEDVVLFGRDSFAAVAMACSEDRLVWTEVDARYVYRGGQRIEATLTPLRFADAPRAGDRLAGSPPGPEAGARIATGVVRAAGTPREPAASMPLVTTVTHAPALAGEAVFDAAAVFTGPVSLGEALPGAADRPAASLRPPPPARSWGLVLSALQAGGIASVFVGPDGLAADATPGVQELLGQPAASLRGQPLTRFLQLSPLARTALKTARTRGERQTVLASSVAGGQIVVEWVPDSEPGAGYALLLDDTPEAEQNGSIRFKSQLVSLVAHDMRDSLAAVYCGLRMMVDDLPDDHPQRATATQSLVECQRVNRILEDVLAASRPGNLVEVEIDVDTVARGMVARYRSRATSRSITLEDELMSGARVLADLSSLERALGNLIENALDATAPHGRIAVTTAREDRGVPGVRVSVSDTGVGIKKETQPNVFEPFFTDKTRGTGLGLAITRRIALAHHGHIDFDTEEGCGTTFHLWLPRIEPTHGGEA